MPVKANPTVRKHGQRLMLAGYVTILRTVQRKPSTAGEVAEKIGAGGRAVSKLMWRMADLGLVHEVRWEPNSYNHGPYVPRYAFGPGERAKCAVATGRHVVNADNLCPELVAFAPLIHAMLDEAKTVNELREIGGHAKGTVLRMLKHGREIKFFRIADWVIPASGPPYPCFGIGGQADALRPAKTSNTELCRRYHERKRAAQQFAPLAAAFARPVSELEAA